MEKNLGLSNLYIEKVMNKVSKNFKGVYSCNTIPNLKFYKNFSIIVNLSRNDEQGTHWVSIFRKGKILLYYDSLGLPLTNRDIKTFLCRINKQYDYNLFQNQCYDSYNCGFYCLFFCLMMEKGMTFDEFKALFSKNCRKNDLNIVELLTHALKQM